MRYRAIAVAALTAFMVAASVNAGVADTREYLPVGVGDAQEQPEVDLAAPPPAQYLPFEHPGTAFAGMGRVARAAARPVPEDSGEGRRIVYAVRAQRVWLVEADGTIVDSYLVSGRRNMPRPGTYRVYSKSLRTVATHDGITMRFMVRFARNPNGVPIGFHDLPRYANGRPMQTTKQLGTYQSGGCVRQSRAHAIQLYEWAPLGTKVVVLR